ncbi:MAG TPA: hypothetical protein VEX15_19215 [Nocardioidaceae bacterium]|nr:hypothetical protein [Nocardioidaceae bacterium]
MTVSDLSDGCRAERASADGSPRWAPAAGFVLFIAGYAGTVAYVGNTGAADRLEGVVQFDMWVALLGALGGFALAAGMFFAFWLVRVVRLSRQIERTTVASWAVIVLLIQASVFAGLFLGASGAEASIDKDLAIQTRPITLFAGLCMTPGLATFLALRWIAADDSHWDESGRCRVRLIIQLRADLRRLLTTFGAFLTLLVITTGLRRRALLAFDPDLPVPPEQVLLYGLIFAVMLGAFYGLATTAIDARAQRIIDEFAPLPDPADPTLSDQIQRRNDLATLTGGGGSWRSFETTVVIAAPLLTALIGIATST